MTVVSKTSHNFQKSVGQTEKTKVKLLVRITLYNVSTSYTILNRTMVFLINLDNNEDENNKK